MADIDLSLERAVSDRLIDVDSRWTRRPPYERFDGLVVLDNMASVALAYHQLTGLDDYQEDLEKSREFVQNAASMFEADQPGVHRYDWVFAVPARTGRRQGNEYATEITPFLPMLDPKYGVDANIRQRSIVGLPPSIIETYMGDRGAIVYTPLHEDMISDYASRAESMGVIQESITSTAMFARRLGAGIMGLGAVLPSLTNYGKTINVEGLETTTGHGGTVFLLAETVKEILETTRTAGSIGVIGASGAIGSSVTDVMLGSDYDFNVTKVYDTREDNLRKKLDAKEQWSKIEITDGPVSLLKECDIIVSAITETINLDVIDPGRQLDLTGKIIVDDSQPGCFDRGQVEARGGKLVWVVGQEKQDDISKSRLIRVNGYNFGKTAGLKGNGLWGCETEVAALSLSSMPELAVKGPVDSAIAIAIGSLLKANRISVSSPLQSYGRDVLIHDL